MPVNKPRVEYSDKEPIWSRCRDAFSGEDAIKAKDLSGSGGVYLPRMEGQTTKEYRAYVNRAFFSNYSGRTLDGLTGLVFRRDPVVNIPGGIVRVVENLDMRGSGLVDFSRLLFREIMTTGRGGVLVDFPSTEGMQNVTVGEYEEMGLRPFARYYPAESIVNWKTTNVAGAEVTTMVVLREVAEEESEDRFGVNKVERYRVLELDGGVYVQTVWVKDRGKWIPAGPSVEPRVNGEPWRSIPFTWFGAEALTPDVEDPPLLDLVNINLSHYRTQADLENGAHWTGVPTPVMIGLPEGEVQIELGSTTGIALPHGGDAKFLEFSGSGLKALEDRAKAKEEMMAKVGARMLAGDKRAAETAEAETIRRAGENSVLANVANNVSSGIVAVLGHIARWSGVDGDSELRLNTDYDVTEMSPQMVVAMVKAWQSGAIAHEDVFHTFKRGELLREDREFRDLLNEIEVSAGEMI